MENKYKDIDNLIAFAEAGEHKPFQFIRTMSEYRLTCKTRRALKRFTKKLQNQSASLLKRYCKSVSSGKADSNLLLAYSKLCSIAKFYKEECDIMIDMINEYEVYLFDGNLVSAAFGCRRPYEDLVDYRKARD